VAELLSNKLVRIAVLILVRVFIESPFKFSGLFMLQKKQQQKYEAKAPHLWLVTGAIKNMAVPPFPSFLSLSHD